jgi:uncharacterized protein YpmB
MKAVLLSLLFLLPFYIFSQTIYDEEWYNSIEEPINFIIYKRKCETAIQFRIYRGFEESYKVYLLKEDKIVYETELKEIDEFDISKFYPGIYSIKVEDKKGNSITKELIIGY